MQLHCIIISTIIQLKKFFFEKEIDKKIILIFISNNVFLDNSLATFVYINWKKDIIINKMLIDYIIYLA